MNQNHKTRGSFAPYTIAFTVALLLAPLAAVAARIELANELPTDGMGKLAAEEIWREAAARVMTLGDDATAMRVSLTECHETYQDKYRENPQEIGRDVQARDPLQPAFPQKSGPEF